MPLTPAQAAQLSIFRTKPLATDGNFVLGWQQYLQSIVTTQANSPTAYRVTHAQRLKLQASSINLGSLAFETDTSHVLAWNGTAWQQLI